MSDGVLVLVAAVAFASAFGLYRAARDGRFRGTRTLSRSGARPAGQAGADAWEW